MKILSQTVENLVIYMVIITIITNLMGNSVYKKYVQIFTGMVLILILIKPMLSFLHWDNKLDFSFITEEFNVSKEEIQNQLLLAEGKQREEIVKTYEEELRNQIAKTVEEEGGTVTSCKIKISREEENFGSIEAISVFCSSQDKDLKRKEENSDEELLIQKIKKIQVEEIQVQENSHSSEKEMDVFSNTTKQTEKEKMLKNKIVQIYGVEKGQVNIKWN